VLGKRVVANPKPGIRRLPATGLDDPAALPVVTLVAAILLGGFVLRRYRFTL
jgi:LPXTG-motif cell wall-anchored protein